MDDDEGGINAPACALVAIAVLGGIAVIFLAIGYALGCAFHGCGTTP